MHVCQAIREEIKIICGIATSEPLLLEAASCIMRGSYGFSLPDILIEVLSGFHINPVIMQNYWSLLSSHMLGI